jgi:hypothetical protein
VMSGAIRAERGVRLNAPVAGRVSVLVRSEPALGAPSLAGRGGARWWRPLAGAAVAASVAAVSILLLRGEGQAPLSAQALRSAPSRAAAPAGAPLPVVVAGATDSYVVPPAPHVAVAVVPTTELANYVVAHSMYSSPVARRNLLSAFMTSESAGAGVAAAPAEPAEDPQRDAPSNPQ